jgi:hypothetical protein
MTIASTELGATGRYINLGSPSSQDNTGAQTIIVYCKPTGAGGGGAGYLLGKTPSGSPNGLRFVLSDNAGSPILLFGSSSTSVTASPSATSTAGAITYGNWYHFEVTYSGALTASAINFFVSGASSARTDPVDGGGSSVSDASDDLFLMNRGGSGSLGREFVGSVAYIARWNRVLNSTERTSVRTNGPLSVPSGLILCWANDQDYSTNALTATARSTRVTGDTPTNDLLGNESDTTAPTLTSPTATATGSTTASGTVSTNEGNGTLYYLVSANATELLATVKAGSSQAVSASGVQSVSVTGLTASTAYYLHYAHTDSAANDSGVANSAQFTTFVAGTKGARVTLYNGGTLQASLSSIRALWWDATEPSGAPVLLSTTETTDGGGVLEININAVTSLSIGQSGFLLLYKLDGADHRDSPVFAGRVAVSDIS